MTVATGIVTTSALVGVRLKQQPALFLLCMISFCSSQVAVLKDHFSRYGVISSVVLEDPEHTENEGLMPSENCSACITFATRHSAERAYQTGKCWEGRNLQFKWLLVAPNTYSDCSIQETSSSLSPKMAPRADIQVTSGSSSLCAEKLTCTVASDVAAVGKVGTDRDIQGTSCSAISLPKSLGEDSQFSPTISSHEKCPL